MPPTAIVLLHGQPDFSASLWPLRSALHGRLGHQVKILVPDRPGYGANPLPPTDFTGNATWLESVLRRAEVGKVIIVGHSWAGGIAIMSAVGNRDRVGGLVLMASIGPDCLLPIDPLLAMPVVGEVAAFSSLKLGRRLLLRHAVGPLRESLSEHDRIYARASALAMLRRPVWRSFLSEQRSLIDQLPVITEALTEVAVPTLVISGTQDQLIPPATPRALHERIPRAQRANIAGAGHDLHLRRVSEVAERMSAFLRPLLGQS